MDEAAKKRFRDSHLPIGQRSDYKTVWDRQGVDFDVATLAVVGDRHEVDLDKMAEWTIAQLAEKAPIGPNDVILEIGCGVGRVGRVLSPRCLHWFGADISGAILRHAAEHLRDCPNTTLVELATVGLQEFPVDAFDLVYSTVVFMHLLPWDRYRYVEEALRVLRPGGHAYFDNVPLDTEHGWKVFMESAGIPLERRPAHISMCSTREELRVYLEKAGFAEICVRDLPNGFIAATGRKPEVG